MPVTLIPDHASRAIANLTSRFKDADTLHTIITVLVGEVQELEALFYALIVSRQLGTAVGAQLDEYGAVLKEPRAGLVDADYRLFLRARILTNLGEGEVPRIIQVLKLITGATRVRYMGTYPASFTVQYERDGFTAGAFRDRVRAQVESITPSGVGVNVVEANLGAFGFADDPTAQGFGVGEFAEIL